MKVTLIGFDSMGTRGMATFVETPEATIFIDPGVSLAPRRFGLPPHPLELRALEDALGRIHDLVEEADYIVISHYHRDHYLYRKGEESYYEGKIVFAKDYQRDINYSQKARAYNLFVTRGIAGRVARLEFVDGRSLQLGDKLVVEFSPPMPHGQEGSRLGWVLYTVVRTSEGVLLHASDAQGPSSTRGIEYIKRVDPDLLIISGPPTYLPDYRYGKGIVEQGVRGLCEVALAMRDDTTIVVDHHLLRDLEYNSVFETVRNRLAESGKKVRIVTAAEYMGLEINLLEARRRELWKGRG
ncbi:MBL fold metallo-hydrolase [Thermogladius sp. 4427co]|uniref:MBL fold metallo-hydrolase n=1 Tax=Thermogladius sp. 4427co TaxID=3450718 RepID=UPI003F79A31D